MSVQDIPFHLSEGKLPGGIYGRRYKAAHSLVRSTECISLFPESVNSSLPDVFVALGKETRGPLRTDVQWSSHFCDFRKLQRSVLLLLFAMPSLVLPLSTLSSLPIVSIRLLLYHRLISFCQRCMPCKQSCVVGGKAYDELFPMVLFCFWSSCTELRLLKLSPSHGSEPAITWNCRNYDASSFVPLGLSWMSSYFTAR